MTSVSGSKHLQDLLATRSGSVDAHVVFLDIVNYSKRKTTVQKRIVERLQSDLTATLTDIGRVYLEYIQANNVNFSTDVIVLPTGDGAAVAFTFGGIQSVALDFSTSLLKRMHDAQSSNPCQKFEDEGWCNCHDYYGLRIGINEGKGIIFEDINGQVNMAGTCLNDAARIMSRADSGQILLSETAYINLIDMSADETVDQKIVALGLTKVKHDRELNVYQYVGHDEPYISSNPPVIIELEREMKQNLSKIGIPIPGLGNMDPTKMLGVMRLMGGVMDEMQAALPGTGQPKKLK